MISVTQAAGLIGITRAAVYKAIEKNALRALHIGNVTVVDRASALAYKGARREASPSIARPRRVARSA
jgi:excisionase family DNA binding protein